MSAPIDKRRAQVAYTGIDKRQGERRTSRTAASNYLLTQGRRNGPDRRRALDHYGDMAFAAMREEIRAAFVRIRSTSVSNRDIDRICDDFIARIDAMQPKDIHDDKRDTAPQGEDWDRFGRPLKQGT